MVLVGGISFRSALVTLKCERNVRCVVGHLKISAPIDDPCRLSRRLMALRRKAVCVANHNKGACGLSFRLTSADVDCFSLDQIRRPVRRAGAFRRVSTGAGFLRVSRGFQLSFLRECPIIDRSGSFGSLVVTSADGRRPPRHIRIFNAFPVGFIYFQLMDGAEAPDEHQHGATDESRTADF